MINKFHDQMFLLIRKITSIHPIGAQLILASVKFELEIDFQKCSLLPILPVTLYDNISKVKVRYKYKYYPNYSGFRFTWFLLRQRGRFTFCLRLKARI